jgi:hypothetical protein
MTGRIHATQRGRAPPNYRASLAVPATGEGIQTLLQWLRSQP